MEKSIESIWKKGFLENDALVAPKLNNLYTQKSIDIVDKFGRMYKINIISIVLFALILMPLTLVVNMPYMGMPMFFLFGVITFFAIKFKKKLDVINKNANSYEYLKTFDNWIKEMTNFNTNLSRYLYPYVFLSMVAGFWFGSFGGNIPGNELTDLLVQKYPNTILIFGIPLFILIILLVVISVLAFFGGKIGQWDLKIGYGRILKRLDTLLADMEELRALN